MSIIGWDGEHLVERRSPQKYLRGCRSPRSPTTTPLTIAYFVLCKYSHICFVQQECFIWL